MGSHVLGERVRAADPFFSSPGALSLGITFLPKTTVNVRAVEIMKGYRLTQKTIEEISFKVRRHVQSVNRPLLLTSRGGTDSAQQGGNEKKKAGFALAALDMANVPSLAFQVAFFQDDVFPPTRLPPSVSASAWLQGSTDQPGVVDLRPEDMKPRTCCCSCC